KKRHNKTEGLNSNSSSGSKKITTVLNAWVSKNKFRAACWTLAASSVHLKPSFKLGFIHGTGPGGRAYLLIGLPGK
ncbi:MAG: hypothetical protein KDD02_18990, partial [Phaeodactylibacter sp.]|nr:hypothetical protein [Phaeodactylibacter sp.]